MKFIFFLSTALFCSLAISAQELYVATEPASNMPAHSAALRITNEGMFKSDFRSRNVAEAMIGINKSLMVHTSAYLSDFYQEDMRFEGGSLYAKYRFLSIDKVGRHLRGAFYARYSHINNPLTNEAINLEGDNTGVQTGLILTQLIHKLALSGSLSYTKAFDNGRYQFSPGQSSKSIGYTFSSGYLLYPKIYRDYNQANMNLYVEFLGRNNPGTGKNLMDAAPAVQFIINSTFRIDISQRFQLWGNMSRSDRNMYLIRLEYNFFNVF